MDYDCQEAMKLANQLCFPLYAAARHVTGLYTPVLRPLGLTYTQYIVFLVLWEKDGQPVGEIGEKLLLDNGTLSPLLKKMEQAGYVADGSGPRPAGKGEGRPREGRGLYRPAAGKGAGAVRSAV